MMLFVILLIVPGILYYCAIIMAVARLAGGPERRVAAWLLCSWLAPALAWCLMLLPRTARAPGFSDTVILCAITLAVWGSGTVWPLYMLCRHEDSRFRPYRFQAGWGVLAMATLGFLCALYMLIGTEGGV